MMPTEFESYKDLNYSYSKSNGNHIKIGYTKTADNHQEVGMGA